LGGITLPLEIFRDPRLTGADIQFLVALMEYRDAKTGKVNPGADSIAAISGLSSSSIDRARKNLKKHGWIRYTSGDNKTANDYTITIPLEAEFKYRTRATKMENGEWRAEVSRRDREAKAFALKRKRADKQWYIFDDEELVEELEHEKKAGINYIPDDVLKVYEILRGGDNSEEARWKRKEETESAKHKGSTPGGVQDQCADEYELDDSKDSSSAEDEYAGYTRPQLVDLQFDGVKLPQHVIEKFNLDPTL
jgi:hypothetical protein